MADGVPNVCSRTDALPTILESLRQASQAPRSPFHLHRVLTILLYTVKECTTLKLMRDKVTIGQIAPEILRVLGSTYVAKVNAWQELLRNGGNDQSKAVECLKESLLALRTLRRLLISFFEYSTSEPDISEFWNLVGTHFDIMLPLILNKSPVLDTAVNTLIGQNLLQVAKYHLKMAQTHPTGFALLPNASGLARAYWDLIKQFGPSFGMQDEDIATLEGHGHVEENETPIIEKLILKGFLFLRACGKMVYNPTKTISFEKSETKAEKEFARSMIKDEVFSDDFVLEILEVLIPQYFVLRTKDLIEWREEPEEWERREESESEMWELSIRTCSEKLLLDLIIFNKETLVTPLLGIFLVAASMSH